ncbi:hypothetical protein V6N11_022548 [Hibiscus sabdariffa]|uniref:Uncharacterized protein n=1 Tax=Hibiscus sabdariffa TaxID=183260 RepID=A0ABR2TJJ2_9ROSI
MQRCNINWRSGLLTSRDATNFVKAYTVDFGCYKFTENFTGCQDLAKQKKISFNSDELALECERQILDKQFFIDHSGAVPITRAQGEELRNDNRSTILR